MGFWYICCVYLLWGPKLLLKKMCIIWRTKPPKYISFLHAFSLASDKTCDFVIFLFLYALYKLMFILFLYIFLYLMDAAELINMTDFSFACINFHIFIEQLHVYLQWFSLNTFNDLFIHFLYPVHDTFRFLFKYSLIMVIFFFLETWLIQKKTLFHRKPEVLECNER